MNEDYVTLRLTTEHSYPCKLFTVFTIHFMDSNRHKRFNGKVTMFSLQNIKKLEITKPELYLLVFEGIQFYDHLH